MPDNKADSLSAKADDHSPHNSADESTAEPEFAEVDQTGRYGRYNEILGKGAFKTVYRAFDEVDGIEVAWNQVKIQDLLQSPEELERLYSEVNLLKSLKHKNIIKFYTSWVDVKNKNVNFITEIFNSGTLRQYRKKHKHVDIKALKSWARQILRGLLYLHSHDPPIIHRDLKCDNIFVNGNNGEVKIGDLGLATILRQAHAAHSVIGTPEFMAPELYEEEYNELVDIYSFGMCLLELVTFEYPYSECTNAAQIYKKVTSGKKPAALDKVKDPDTRNFIENCLAVVSKRLPARELLSDPFLQSDVNKEQSECPPMSLPRSEFGGEKLDEFVVRKEPESSSHHRSSRFGLAESKTITSDAVRKEPALHMKPAPLKSVSSNEALSNSDCDSGTLSAFAKDDELGRSRDFRVKGKKRDENTVFLRLRIADPQGHVRHIHFVFDIESDTAISVASEMVEELQLSDQDVTTIAEMIDAKILALVPDWKPGASFEDVTPDTGYSDQDCLPDLSCKRSEREIGADETSVDESCMVNTLITQDFHSSVLSPSTNADSPARGEGVMYGRFEEVTYNQGGSEYSPSSSGAPPPLSCISFDHQAYEDSLYNVADRTSPEVDPAGRDTGGTAHGTVSNLLRSTPTDACGAVPGEIGCMAFNDLVECQRNAGCSKYTHQSWEMIMNMDASSEGQHAYAEAEMHVLDKGFQSPLPWAFDVSAAITPTELTDGEEELDQELKNLAFKQEQELIELRRKHENAISEAKTRWEKKSGTTVSSRLVQDVVLTSDMMHSNTVFNPYQPSSGIVNEGSAHGLLSPLVDWEAQLATVREISTSRKSMDLDRLSLEELSALTSHTSKDMADKPSTTQPSCSSFLEVVNNVDSMHIHMESAVEERTAALKDTFCDEKNHVVDDGDEQVCGHRTVFLQDVMMKCVAESSPPFDKSLTNRIETLFPETQVHHKLVLGVHSLLKSTTARNKRLVSNELCVCDPKEISLEELGSRHSVWHPTINSAFLEEVKLPDLESSKLEVFSTKAQKKDMQGTYMEPCENTGKKIVCSEAHVWMPEGNQLQGSAGPASATSDRKTVPTVCEDEASSSTNDHPKQLVRGKQGICADAHSNPNKLQELESLNLKCDFEKLVASQSKNSRTSEKAAQSVQERYGNCINSPGAGSIHKEKCFDKAAFERQELSNRTPSCQSGDGSLESKKEQLQRSIAKLEAKTLEGLRNGLTANLATKKPFCGSLVEPTGSTSITPQSRPNLASESSKH